MKSLLNVMSAIRISAVTRGVPVQALVPDVVETVIIHRKIDIVATTLETTDNIIDMSIGTVVVHNRDQGNNLDYQHDRGY